MSDNEDEYDDDGNVITKPAGDGPKALRDQLKKIQKERDELLAENTEFKKSQRTTVIEQALAKHNAPVRLKRLVASEVDDPSEDTVLKWLEENGEDFGWSPEEADNDEELDTRNNAARVSRAVTSAPSKLDKLITPEYIKTAPYEELVRRGIIS